MLFNLISRGCCIGTRPKLIKIQSFPKPCLISKKFSTTQPKKIHPIFYIIGKPLSRLVGMVLGRNFRNWWKKLPKSEREGLKNHLLKNWKFIGAGSLSVTFLISLIGYETVISILKQNWFWYKCFNFIIARAQFI